ncbi:hypothetical protein Tco_0442843 [Tanacetum coccineum]
MYEATVLFGVMSIDISCATKGIDELVPKLVLQIDSLEKEWTKTTQIFGNEVLTLKNRVKTLEVALKRKSKKVGRKSQDDRSEDFITPSNSGEAQEQDISPTLLDAANTLTQVTSGGVSTYKKRRRSVETGIDYLSATKERTKSEEVNTEVAEQIYTDEMIAKRMEEEKEMTDQQKQRMAQIQFEAQYYTEEDWDVIRAKL